MNFLEKWKTKMKQTTDKTINTGNNDFSKNVEKFTKWAKVCIITTIVMGAFGIGASVLSILKKFTDLEVTAPFLYGKTFACIVLIAFLALVTFVILCYVKARKYKKLIERSENKESENETNYQ